MVDLQIGPALCRAVKTVIATVSLFGLAVPPVLAQERDFGAWLEGVRVEARQLGISENVIQNALKDVQPVRRIIERDRNQAEDKLTLSVYLNRVVSKQTVARGRNMSRKHRNLLAQVSRKYGVQGRVILAIWGIETRFGAITANVPLIPSIATLAFDKRRSKYFRSQLISVLKMLDRGYIEQENLLGSWAGAMGQPQFMPSSYLAYAQDFDGDGRRDIWKNTGDVLASIANYLSVHGWKPDMTWGRAVQVPDGLRARLGGFTRRAARGCRARTSEPRRLSEWQAAGVRRINGRNLPTRDLSAVMVIPDGPGGKEAFLVYRNYAAIMGYNCAHLYAVTVGILSDKIGNNP
jgi:membrane-bound lytic murein transglycosylase B